MKLSDYLTARDENLLAEAGYDVHTWEARKRGDIARKIDELNELMADEIRHPELAR